MTEPRNRDQLSRMLLTLHTQRDGARAVEAHALVLRLTGEIDDVRSSLATIDVLARVASQAQRQR